jgi:hypothetical protein
MESSATKTQRISQTIHEEQEVRQFAASRPEAMPELEQRRQLPPEL